MGNDPEKLASRFDEYRKKLAAGEVELAKPKNHIQKWKERNTRAMAINAFCCQCMGGTEDDMTEVRVTVAGCTSPECPLYEWRPYK